MPNSKYKVIIFDFGGVLGTRSDLWGLNHNNISKLTGIPPNVLSNMSKKMWPQLETGKLDANDFWEKVVKSSSTKISQKELEEAYEKNFHQSKDVISLAKKVKSKGYKVAIFSNASKKWMDFKIKKLNLHKTFDKIYNSADIGMTKPDLESYQYVLNDLEVKPEEAIFIDDQIENIKAANELGINGIIYKDPERLKEDLESLLNIPL